MTSIALKPRPDALPPGPRALLRRRLLPLLACTIALTGCASLGVQAGNSEARQPITRSAADPLESLNRSIFSFNEAVDDALVAPVARAYAKGVPQPVRTAVGRVFANVGDAWSSLNHLMQAKPRESLEMAGRFAINSTIGLAGLIDVASDMGLERQREDFGQTLGRWGVGAGPYLVLPLLGPSSLRDALALPLDRKASLPALVPEVDDRNALTALGLVQARSELLSATGLVQQVALDRYSFVRDAYLARRRNLVWDGNPPAQPEDEDADGARAPR